MKEKVLVVKEQLMEANSLRNMLQKAGYAASSATGTLTEAVKIIETDRPDCVLIDILFKGIHSSIDLAQSLTRKNIPYIFLADHKDEITLKAARSTSPYGFIFKPLREKDLLLTLEIAKNRHRRNRQQQPGYLPGDHDLPGLATGLPKTQGLPATPPVRQPISANQKTATDQQDRQSSFSEIIGESQKMQRVLDQVRQVARYDSTVLILGETGAGKEGLVNAIHQHSLRSSKPLIKINCAAIPRHLVESELFGHERGAFTGAADRRIGKFELADGGTIFLDEIGEMPLEMQTKLLRVLQEKEIERIGGRETIKTDIRVIAATNRNLQKDVEAGKFRSDLYFRLNVFPIAVPALRERKEDISLLAHHFLQKHARRSGKDVTGFTRNVLEQLFCYNWPGNVRELEHLVERSILQTTGPVISAVNLPGSGLTDQSLQLSDCRIRTIEEVERDHILFVLSTCNGKVAGHRGAAEMLNIPSTTLSSKLKRLGISNRG